MPPLRAPVGANDGPLEKYKQLTNHLCESIIHNQFQKLWSTRKVQIGDKPSLWINYTSPVLNPNTNTNNDPLEKYKYLTNYPCGSIVHYQF